MSGEGRDDSSASGSFGASNLRRPLSAGESERPAVAARPTPDTCRLDSDGGKLPVGFRRSRSRSEQSDSSIRYRHFYPTINGHTTSAMSAGQVQLACHPTSAKTWHRDRLQGHLIRHRSLSLNASEPGTENRHRFDQRRGLPLRHAGMCRI